MFDVLVRGGRIIDGSGKNKNYKADLGIKGDEIIAIGNLDREVGIREIDARGRTVTPGFIDIHTHSDTYSTLFKYPDQASFIHQGVTTIFGGNCGSSLAPILGEGSINSLRKWNSLTNLELDWERMGEFLSFLEENVPLGINFGTLVGHATLRRGIGGDKIRPFSQSEIKLLTAETKRAIQEGAWGLSVGLAYTHVRAAEKEELIALGEAVAECDGILTVHLRDEGIKLLEAVGEILEIVEKTGVNLQISHLKADGRAAWPLMDKALNALTNAYKKGLNVNFDIYPYSFSRPILYTLLPDWVISGYNREKLLKELKNPVFRKKVVTDMEKGIIDYSHIYLASSPLSPLMENRSIGDIALARGAKSEEVILDLLLASEDQVSVFVESLSEKNVERAIANQLGIISSNGAGYTLERDMERKGELIHPRSFGTFCRYLSYYIGKKNILSKEKAIHKITGLPAKKFKLPLRGQIKEGFKADICIFDWENLKEKALVGKSPKYSEGMEYVLVNGETALDKGVLVKGFYGGKVLAKE